MKHVLTALLLVAAIAAGAGLPPTEIRECNTGELTLGPYTTQDGSTPQIPDTGSISLDIPLPAVKNTPQAARHLWDTTYTSSDFGACPTPLPTAAKCLTETVPQWAFQVLNRADTTAIATYDWYFGSGGHGVDWQKVTIHARPVPVLCAPTPTPSPSPSPTPTS
jgi:hypothetical protein